MADNNYSNDDETNALKQLDQQGAEYWLRAAQWNSQDAACLLLGIEPRGFDGRKQLTYIRATRINSILGEIRHVEGDGASHFWDRWPPRQWLMAARKAQIPVHPVFDAALAELKARINAADKTQKPQEDRLPPNLPVELRAGIAVFDEFWSDLPDDMNQADKPAIISFLGEEYGLTGAPADRVFTSSRPATARTGPESTEKRKFRRKSERG